MGRTMKSVRYCVVLSVGLMLVMIAGCLKVGPDYHSPQPSIPDQWHQELVAGLQKGKGPIERWWKQFHDSTLEELITRARNSNQDLASIYWRIHEAAWQFRAAGAGYAPTIDLAASASRRRVHEVESRLYNTSSKVTWELDLWGRVSRLLESSKATYQAEIENYRDALVVLYSNVAETYVNLRVIQKRLDYARQNVARLEKILQITQDRMKAGNAMPYDVERARSYLCRVKSTIPSLEQAYQQQVNHLAVLLGGLPEDLRKKLSHPNPIPAPPASVVVNIPADWIRQRPDIRRAERELAAQNARIGVATADLYPRLTLLGAFSYEGVSLRDLFSPANMIWSFGPSISWNIFNGGQVRASIMIEDARTQQAYARYRQTVLKAIEEVENALVAYVKEQRRYELLSEALVAGNKSLKAMAAMYQAGLTSLREYLDEEGLIIDLQDRLAISQGQRSINVIHLYKAMGGGWQSDILASSADKQIGTKAKKSTSNIKH